MKKRGFSLIEVVVVISIISLITSIVSTNLLTARAESRDAKRAADIAAIRRAIELYYDVNGSYPPAGGVGASPNDFWSNSNHAGWATLMTYIGPTAPAATRFLSVVPQDPSQSAIGWPGGGQNSYAYFSGSYGCGTRQFYMIVYRPETGGITSPGIVTCDGTVFNYPGTITTGAIVR